MRFAFVISSGLGYQIPNLFETEDSFEQFEKALECLRENDFDGVELNLHFDDNRRLSKIRDSISQSGLKLAAVGTGLVYILDELSFTNPDPNKRARALSIVKQLVEFASEENASVVIGLVRGGGQCEAKDAVTHLRDCLAECDSAARRCGTRIALEAINRYETGFLNTASEVSAFVESSKLNSTGILLDTFHMNIEEQSLEETIRAYRPRLVHFHIADSNRWPPSYGHLKIEDSLHLLNDLGYDGWVSAETLPKPSSIEAVRTTAKFLKGHHFMRA
jgi:sugar phosphate isomerase/epimerase